MRATSHRTLAIVVIIAVAVLAGLGAMVVRAWTPTVPVDAAAVPITRTELRGDVLPDPSEGTDPSELARSPFGQECLPTIERSAGPLSLCWEAYRDPRDTDPDKDYYRLRVYGTFGGETGTGVRWVVVRARLIGDPADRVFYALPDGTYDGPCTQVDLSIGAAEPGGSVEWLCGRTVGVTDDADWSHTVTWTCDGCLLADHADRAITLVEWVGVPEGDVPAWDLHADLGS